MICPRCHGKGRIASYEPARRAADSLRLAPCDYPGCVGGAVHCCEGDQEQPATTIAFDSTEWITLTPYLGS